jgi:hypothetical protein
VPALYSNHSPDALTTLSGVQNRGKGSISTLSRAARRLGPDSATWLAGTRLGELYRVDYLDQFQIRVGQELMEVLLKPVHFVCLSLMFPVQYT